MRGDPAQSYPGVSMVDSEGALLSAFIDALEILDPDLLLGWHVEGFGLRVLQDLAERCRRPLSLGCGRRELRTIPLRNDQYVVVPGRVVIDGPTALRQNFFTYENYGLDAVAQLVLDRGELIQDPEVAVSARWMKLTGCLPTINLLWPDTIWTIALS